MLYRKMKKSGKELSILGFGCMRLPTQKDGTVDVGKAIEAIRYGIDHGINYADTAYVYHGGESEIVLGKALQDGYRAKVNVATKLPTWLVQKREDMVRYLDEQLKKLQTDHVDFYLIHGLGEERWKQMVGLGVSDFLDDALADGRIRHAGFSFHDKAETFQPIVDGYGWTFCQIQYNYMDEQYQAGTKGLKYAASKGLDVIVMEPLRGGMLTRKVPEVEKLWAGAEKGRSPAGWGLRWVWNHPEVTVVLSGMSSLDQVKENLKYAGEGRAGSLTKPELALISKVKAAYRKRVNVDCTACEYCMPCPNGVDIPGCFGLLNNASMYGIDESMKFVYNTYNAEGKASKCCECGECADKCPQQIPIPEKLKEVKELFGK